MRTLIGFTFGIIITLIGVTYLIPQQTQYETQVITHTETVYTDLDQLRLEYADLAEQLRHECLLIIERQTGDPMPGIEHHVNRHYQGDACRAADQALNGEW